MLMRSLRKLRRSVIQLISHPWISSSFVSFCPEVCIYQDLCWVGFGYRARSWSWRVIRRRTPSCSDTSNHWQIFFPLSHLEVCGRLLQSCWWEEIECRLLEWTLALRTDQELKPWTSNSYILYQTQKDVSSHSNVRLNLWCSVCRDVYSAWHCYIRGKFSGLRTLCRVVVNKITYLVNPVVSDATGHWSHSLDPNEHHYFQ